MLNPSQVERIFVDTGAILSGHFLLTSGLHSEKYLQCARVLQWPRHAEDCAQALATHFLALKPEFVISPALGGIVIGHELGRALGCHAIFAERENGLLRLRRGFSVAPGEKGVVVEDVITTGGSTAETIKVVQDCGGVVLGACAIVDRGVGNVHFDAPHYSLWKLSIPTYVPEDCPLCRAGSSPTKPGSRSSR